MIDIKSIKVIAFDAGDTLWDNQSWYDRAENKFTETLKEYGSAEQLSDILYQTESSNMKILGFGAKAVCISMMETALKIAGDKITSEQLGIILSNAKALLQVPATPLPGVADTLDAIRKPGRFRMILLTKGDILDQQNKIARSGLGKFFDRVIIVSDKGKQEYIDLCESEGISPGEFLMVGNSFKSDIKPVLEIGGYGIHIPFHTTWRHERIEEFSHSNVVKANCIADITGIIAG